MENALYIMALYIVTLSVSYELLLFAYGKLLAITNLL